MKIYTLAAKGIVTLNSYGDIEVNGVDVLKKFAESFGLSSENFQTKQFAGAVEITLKDIIEPLEIDAKEC